MVDPAEIDPTLRYRLVATGQFEGGDLPAALARLGELGLGVSAMPVQDTERPLGSLEITPELIANLDVTVSELIEGSDAPALSRTDATILSTLGRAGITTVRAISIVGAYDLLGLRTFGGQSLNRLKAMMAERGLVIPDDPADIDTIALLANDLSQIPLARVLSMHDNRGNVATTVEEFSKLVPKDVVRFFDFFGTVDATRMRAGVKRVNDFINEFRAAKARMSQT